MANVTERDRPDACVQCRRVPAIFWSEQTRNDGNPTIAWPGFAFVLCQSGRCEGNAHPKKILKNDEVACRLWLTKEDAHVAQHAGVWVDVCLKMRARTSSALRARQHTQGREEGSGLATVRITDRRRVEVIFSQKA